MNKTGKLYLIPVALSEHDVKGQIPPQNLPVIFSLHHFVVENERSARRFLKAVGYSDISSAKMQLLDNKTEARETERLLKPLLEGENVGLLSEAGAPGVADPGAEITALAHARNIQVFPLAGPSSILLALSASGFNGQNFSFLGYLPQDQKQRIQKLREIERTARKNKQSQFFIETPYRNRQMIESLLQVLQPDTKVFIGSDILGENPYIRSLTVKEWKKINIPDLHKIPAVFGIY